MSNQKKLNSLINKMVGSSFKNSKLNKEQVEKYAKLIDKLPKLKKMLVLKAYLKGLKKYIEDRTLKIESPVELRTEDFKKLEAEFSQQFSILSASWRTKFSINKDLLGGVRIRIGDFIYDDSLKLRINNLKGALSV